MSLRAGFEGIQLHPTSSLFSLLVIKGVSSAPVAVPAACCPHAPGGSYPSESTTPNNHAALSIAFIIVFYHSDGKAANADLQVITQALI